MFTLSNNLNNVNLEIWETAYHFMGVLQSVWSQGFLQFTICVWALRYLVELVRREITLAICKILIKIRNKDIQFSHLHCHLLAFLKTYLDSCTLCYNLLIA